MSGHAHDDWIERARAVRIETFIKQRSIVLKRAGRRGRSLIGACPRCGGSDRFAVHCGRQVFNCRGCGAKGGGAISFVQFLDCSGFLDAVAKLAGPPPDAAKETDTERAERERLAAERRERSERKQREREAREAADAQSTLRYCDDLFAQAVTPLPPAYFAGRGISLDDVPDEGGLRFHRACPFDGERLPCVIARFTDAVTNAPGGLWRRPISGGLKPMSLGPMRGHVLRLWPDEDVTMGLVIGEGVETCLAASRIVHNGTLLCPVPGVHCFSLSSRCCCCCSLINDLGAPLAVRASPSVHLRQLRKAADLLVVVTSIADRISVHAQNAEPSSH